MKRLIITIDGPAGSGKSTVSRILARHLNYTYLDTGALYRALAFKADREGIAPDDEAALDALSARTVIDLSSHPGSGQVLVDGEDVTGGIRTERISRLASAISALPAVRQALLSLQRKQAEAGAIVAEGRDMGTVVFPDADVKFYLDAQPNERAKRRYEELRGHGPDTDIRQVIQDLQQRDRQDQERPIAPLKIPEDAVVIDSSHLTVEEVVMEMMTAVRLRGG